MNFIIDLLITMVAYMAYPFIKFKLSNKGIEYTKEQINKTCIINSVVWAIIFLIIGVNSIENYEPNFAPAFVWYCINYSIFTHISNTKSNKTNENTTTSDKWQEYVEKNYKSTGTRTDMQTLKYNETYNQSNNVSNNINYKNIFVVTTIILGISLIISIGYNVKQYLELEKSNQEYISLQNQYDNYYDKCQKELRKLLFNN